MEITNDKVTYEINRIRKEKEDFLKMIHVNVGHVV